MVDPIIALILLIFCGFSGFVLVRNVWRYERASPEEKAKSRHNAMGCPVMLGGCFGVCLIGMAIAALSMALGYNP